MKLSEVEQASKDLTAFFESDIFDTSAKNKNDDFAEMFDETLDNNCEIKYPKEKKPLSSYNFDGDPEFERLVEIFCGDKTLATYWHVKHLGLDEDEEDEI